MQHGYEPSRLTNLTQQSHWALGALEGIHSYDPAAADAMAAVAQLKSVIADGFIPATTAVGIIDPLGGDARTVLTIERIDGPGAWWDLDATRPNRFAEWTDEQLFDVMLEQDDWFTTQGIWEQPDHFFWSEDVPDLVEQFRLRASSDPQFAQRLIDEAASNPMIGLIVARGGFSDEVLASVTIAIATNGSESHDSGAARSFVLDELLGELDGRMRAAIIIFADPAAFEVLFTWSEHEHTARPLDQTLLETILLDVLNASFVDATTLDDVHHVIANVVDLADHKYFDTGFPPSMAAAIAEGILPFLPYIISSLDDLGGVFIKGFDGDRSALIGTQAQITDLFGNLIRDPDTRDTVIATVTALTVGNDGSLYGDDDLSEYVETLLDAAESEQIEEQIQASRDRDRWDNGLDVVFELIDKGLEAGGPKFAGAREQLHWFEKSARWIVDQIRADEIGLHQVPLAIRIVLSFGIAMVFLRDFRSESEEEEEQASEARRTLSDIEAAVASGQGSTIDVDLLLPMVLDLEEDIEKIDEDAFDVIGDPRLRPDNFVPEQDAELTSG